MVLEKNNHVVHLEIIEQIFNTTLPLNSFELPTMMEQCSPQETDNMLPTVGLPLKQTQTAPTPTSRPKPVFPSLSTQKEDKQHFTEEEMDRTISEDEILNHEDINHLAETLGCSRLTPYTTDQPEHNICNGKVGQLPLARLKFVVPV